MSVAIVDKSYHGYSACICPVEIAVLRCRMSLFVIAVIQETGEEAPYHRGVATALSCAYSANENRMTRTIRALS